VGGADAGGESLAEEKAGVDVDGLCDAGKLKPALLGELGFDDECSRALALNCCRSLSVLCCWFSD
jgi:hypothetical protein